jgi:hypothetical protein
MPTEEPERADVGDYGLDRYAAFRNQGDVILPDRVRAQAIEAPTRMATEVLDDADVTANGDRGVLASNELVVETLQQFGHRQSLLRHTLRCYKSSGSPSGRRASGFVLVAMCRASSPAAVQIGPAAFAPSRWRGGRYA